MRAALATVAKVYARSVSHGSEDPWNVSQLPPEVREAVMHLCGHLPSAEHYFATYFQNSRLIKLHFEHLRCEGHPRHKVDVIATTIPAVATLKQATSVIPIVFALASDPVGGGAVASLARPGGNVTGLSTQTTDLASKRVELLREVVPHLRLFAILGNGDNPEIALEMREVEGAGQKLDLQVATLKVRRAEDIAPALELLKGRAQALYVCTDPLTVANRVSINTLALAAQLPTMHDVRNLVEAGGLMSYGPNWSDQFR